MKRKIKILKSYRDILIEIKKIQIINLIDEEVEKKLPTYGTSNQKTLALKKA